MTLPKGLQAQLPVWLDAGGPHSEMVVSSRIRLARNLHGYKFIRLASAQDRLEVYRHIEKQAATVKSLAQTHLVDVDGLSEMDRQFLVERHLISPDMERLEGKRGVFVNSDQTMGIMVNEEDHLRLQCILSGFRASEAWDRLNRADDDLAEVLDYAFSRRWGFLTACPTNAGTGMRVSVLIHLPALVLTKNMDKVIHGINQLGLSVRGLYGEGSEVLGNLFQISNQTTLGKKEEDLLETLDNVIQQIIGYEKTACTTLLDDARPQIEDKVWRAYGILRSARLLNSNEFMNISSAVRLGVILGILKDVDLRTLNELMTLLQPAHLQINHGQEMSPTDRDVLRADIVRTHLSR